MICKYLTKQGFEVTSLDNNKSAEPDICIDIMEWNYREYPPKYFRLKSAGPPCTEYSRAKTVGERKLEEADQVVIRTLEIIEYSRPEIWWLENPRTGLLKERPFMQNIPYIDVDYCQFSDWGYRKPTRIWGCSKI